MAGAAMHTDINEGNGQIVGSHIKMNSTILGIRLFLDEVVTLHDPPRVKTWETVGNVHLLVIGHYRMGVSIKPEGNSSDVTVSIDYNLPNSHTWLGKLFGGIYAKWCVEQMTQGVKTHFTH